MWSSTSSCTDEFFAVNHKTARSDRQNVWSGTLRVFAAELLIVPTGLVIAIFLSRRLGPADYGLYSLAAVLSLWVSNTIAALFSRAIIKFVSEADDWRAIGATVLRWDSALALGAMLLVWLCAEPISIALGEPILSDYLWIAALDIPLFVLARTHREILIGLGQFGQRALASAGRWLARVALIVLFVELGLGIAGAFVGAIGASLVDLLIARWYVRPSFSHRARFPASRLWSYATPLFLFVLVLGAYDKLGLFAYKMLGGTAEGAGWLSAAQNLTIVPGVLALSFSPLLLSSLNRALHENEMAYARSLARNALRGVMLLLPFAGMTAGMASQVIEWILGRAYLPAAPLLAWLIFAALALLMVSVVSAILIAADKPRWTFALTAIALPFALIGYIVVMPLFDVVGIAAVTALAAFISALAMLAGAYRAWRILPPRGSVLRAALVCVGAYALAAGWTTAGAWLLVKLAVIAVLIAGAYAVLGEFSRVEMATFIKRLDSQDKENTHG